jgi:hypothetical protein
MIKTKKHSRKYIYLLLVLVVVVIIMAVLELMNTTHLLHKSAVVRPPSTPITKLPAPNNATNGNKSPSSTPTLNKGAPTDENGQTPSGVPTDPSKWSTSASGVITVKLPASNTTLQPGGTLTGSATINQVQYRLTDNQVGVISEGPINVVGGNFTASINFTTHGSSGRLDVFSTEPNGREINEVQIPVNF